METFAAGLHSSRSSCCFPSLVLSESAQQSSSSEVMQPSLDVKQPDNRRQGKHSKNDSCSCYSTPVCALHNQGNGEGKGGGGGRGSHVFVHSFLLS